MSVKRMCIDIVFMDMQMPGITGLEASRIIHQINPDIAIYILSAHASSVLIRNAGQETLKDVLEKPITNQMLKKILENYKTEHEDDSHEHMKLLVDLLKRKDFKKFYEVLPDIIKVFTRTAVWTQPGLSRFLPILDKAF